MLPAAAPRVTHGVREQRVNVFSAEEWEAEFGDLCRRLARHEANDKFSPNSQRDGSDPVRSPSEANSQLL
eukprot:g19921.t1